MREAKNSSDVLSIHDSEECTSIREAKSSIHDSEERDVLFILEALRKRA
jgi:hypothetical protein